MNERATSFLADNLAFGADVRSRMRKAKVTIRDLAAEMGVTMKRVREVRNYGTPPPDPVSAGWRGDWICAIADAARRRSGASAPPRTPADRPVAETRSNWL